MTTSTRPSATRQGLRAARLARLSAAMAPALAMLVLVLGTTGPAPGCAQERPLAGKEHRLPLRGLPDFVVPSMDPARGRVYFATRACVVCHAVNGIGGTDGAALDIEKQPETVRVLDFVSRMWRGGLPMMRLQRRLLGEQIDLTGEELADIIAFLHSPEEQRKFSEADIPDFIRDFMAERKKQQQLR